jgi:hypothetical protein
MGEMDNFEVWQEPFFGVLLGFRDNLANQAYVTSGDFLLGEPLKDVWIGAMRRLFLDVCRAKFGNLPSDRYLIVKEPNGSIGASLILDAFPESKLVFLVRDGRDVVASLLDAARKGSWYGYERYEASAADARLENGQLVFPQPRSDIELAEWLAQNYVDSINSAKKAYNKLPKGQKVLVRYEDLRFDTLQTLMQIYTKLGIPVNESEVIPAIGRQSWNMVPEDQKGQGKFFRKATPGAWREDLTSQQVEVVNRIVAPLLDEFYKV